VRDELDKRDQKIQRLEAEKQQMAEQILSIGSGDASGDSGGPDTVDDAVVNMADAELPGMDAPVSAVDGTLSLSFICTAFRKSDGLVIVKREQKGGAKIQLITKINGDEVSDELLGNRVFNECTALYVLYLEKKQPNGTYTRVANKETRLLLSSDGVKGNDFGPISRVALQRVRWTKATKPSDGPVRLCIGLYPQVSTEDTCQQKRCKLARAFGITHSPDLSLVADSDDKLGKLIELQLTAASVTIPRLHPRE
jgi:hypothetical protein